MARPLRIHSPETCEEPGRLIEDRRHGAPLSSAQAWARLCERVRPKAHREIPSGSAIRPMGALPHRLEHWRAALGISDTEFAALRRPVRGRLRPMRDVLTYAVWREGPRGLREIGVAFGFGYTGVVHARRRAERHLAADPRMRASSTYDK